MSLVFLVQLVGGLLLLIGRFVPLAIATLATVLVNILNSHITMEPGSIGPGVFAARPATRASPAQQVVWPSRKL